MCGFFASLKKELVYRCRFETREEAKIKIWKHILVFYNANVFIIPLLTNRQTTTNDFFEQNSPLHSEVASLLEIVCLTGIL